MQKLAPCDELSFWSFIFQHLIFLPVQSSPETISLLSPYLTSLIDFLLNSFMIAAEILAITIMENMDKFKQEK